ncbi:MAG: YggT family protein [Candidatus Riflebacteria bacterium]|nr:YggT family protein [Candidatus Riflebacteria bacterium]
MTLLLVQALRLFELAIILRILMTWFLTPGDRRFLIFTRPIDRFLEFFRVLIPMGRMQLDIGPILALMLIQAVERVLINL